MLDAHTEFPPAPRGVEELEEILSRPPARVVEAMRRIEGDVVFLGVGGKMGPTMARMAHRALREAGQPHEVIGVSRFQDASARQRLESWGIRTIVCDLLDEHSVAQLPPAPHVVAMSGFKFGVGQHPERAWATNCYMPALICRRYRDSQIVAFSTGNVYPRVPADSGGSVESDPPCPDGEYGMTALGRERMYQYFSQLQRTPIVLLRLNYATELRYGVLVDLAQQIAAGQEIDVTMGYVNVIWLGDANAMTLLALPHASSPARIVNLAGPEVVAVPDVCAQLASLMDRPLRIAGIAAPDALLNNGRYGYTLLGDPEWSTRQMIQWTAQWMAAGRPLLGKPTHFQTRSGKY